MLVNNVLFQKHLDSFATPGDRWTFGTDKQITPEIVADQIRSLDYEVKTDLKKTDEKLNMILPFFFLKMTVYYNNQTSQFNQ